MELFTQKQFDQLCENGRPENQCKDWYPVVKLILPGTGCAWLLTEIRPEQNCRYAYGLSDYGYGGVQAGFIKLPELLQLADPVRSDRVQQDLSFIARHRISVYLTAARMCGYITDDAEDLLEALKLHSGHDTENSVTDMPATPIPKRHYLPML